MASSAWKPKRGKKPNPRSGGKDQGVYDTPFPFKCYKCKKTGHKANNCQQQKERAATAEMCFLSSTSGNYALQATKHWVRRNWCLDSGCSSHMCRDEVKFLSKEKCDTGSLNLASNATAKVEGKGTVEIKVSCNSELSIVKLENTLHVPDLRSDLMSVSKITDKGFEVLFRQQNAVVRIPGGEVKMVAYRIGNLYYVCENADTPGAICEKYYTDSLELWHKRLGHLNEKDIKKIAGREKLSE